MKTDNELIAEFMGLEVRDETSVLMKRYLWKDRFYNKNLLKFHESWDWLMPVVEKIVDVAMKDDIPNISGIALKTVCEYPIVIRIDILHNQVVKFIKWYNENKHI